MLLGGAIYTTPLLAITILPLGVPEVDPSFSMAVTSYTSAMASDVETGRIACGTTYLHSLYNLAEHDVLAITLPCEMQVSVHCAMTKRMSKVHCHRNGGDEELTGEQ